MKKFSTLFLVLATMLSVNARRIDSSFAEMAVKSHLTQDKQLHSVKIKNIKYQRLKKSENDTFSPYYIFNVGDNEGFVIVSGNTSARKILAYSDKGAIPEADLPPVLEYLLDTYSKKITQLPEDAPEHPSWYETQFKLKEQGNGGKLLETAKWGQDEPFNNFCPERNGMKSPAGCVATAMAIIMKYHNWPEKGRGYYDPYQDYQYYLYDDWYWSDNYMGADPCQPFDCSSHEFHWNQIDIDNPDADLIAKNMLAIGKTMGMAYTGVSSVAKGETVGIKLHYFFNYSKDCQFLARSNWNNEDWYEMVRNQIDADLPILYCCWDSSFCGNHAFVCDGYDNDGNLHLNLGWNGRADGYYYMEDTETEPSMFGKTGMIINIKPSDDEAENLFLDYGFIWEKTLPKYQPGKLAAFTDSEGKLHSTEFNMYAPSSLVGKLGVGLFDSNGMLKRVVAEQNLENNYYRTKFKFWDFACNDMDEGDELRIVYKTDDSSSWRLAVGNLDMPNKLEINPDFKYIELTWETDERLEFTQAITPHTPKFMILDLSQGLPKKVIKNQSLQFNVKLPEGLQVHVQEGDTDYSYDFVYDYFDKNQGISNTLQFRVNTDKDKIVKVYVLDEEELDVEVDFEEDPNFFQDWSLEDLEKIRSAKAKGPMLPFDNVFGFYCPGIRKLDLSEAKHVVGFDQNTGQFIFGDKYYGELGFKYLEEYHIYGNIQKMFSGNFTSHLSRLTIIGLPETLEEIESPLWHTPFPKTLICRAKVPPTLIADEKSSLFTDDPYDPELRSYATNSTLIVPMGCKEAYADHPEWGLFGRILEYENDWHEALVNTDVPELEISEEDFMVEIFSLDGMSVYKGHIHKAPVLPHGTYIFKTKYRTNKIHI